MSGVEETRVELEAGIVSSQWEWDYRFTEKELSRNVRDRHDL